MLLPFQKTAIEITQEYIEKYGMELTEIDGLDEMIAKQLYKVYTDGWKQGHEAGLKYGEIKSDALQTIKKLLYWRNK